MAAAETVGGPRGSNANQNLVFFAQATASGAAPTAVCKIAVRSPTQLYPRRADVTLAVIDARLGRNVISEALRSRLVDRAYLCDMLERYAARTASRPRDRYRCLLFHIARSCGSPTLSTRSKLASASASDGDLCPCGWQPQLISNVIGSGSKFRHLLHAGMRRRVNEARHC